MFACGGSSKQAGDGEADQSNDALGAAAATTADVEIVVKAKTSKADDAFLSDFVVGFQKIVDIDRRNGKRGCHRRIMKGEAEKVDWPRVRHDSGPVLTATGNAQGQASDRLQVAAICRRQVIVHYVRPVPLFVGAGYELDYKA